MLKGERIFNTGKVAIGAQHQPQTRMQSSHDMVRLQSALLTKNQRRSDPEGVAIVVISAVILAASLIAFWAGK